VEGFFRIPYFDIVEELKLNFDGVNSRQRFDYYHGMDNYIYRYDVGVMYQLVPRIDQKICFVQNITGDSSSLVTLLPDLSSWTFMGTKLIHGFNCNNWQKKVKNFNTTAEYNMYINAADNTPVQLHLFGYDFIFGSHPDIYIMDYKVYKPNFVNQSAFDEPDLCDNAQINTRANFRAQKILGLLDTLTPLSDDVDEFKVWAKMHNKKYANKQEEESRRTIWENNKNYIENHNANSRFSHKLKMNQFGDWEMEEFKSLILPRRDKIRNTKDQDPPIHQISGKKNPPSINWVSLGAVNPPKDQGVCGSCWTFGTAGSLEGAWFLKTKTLVSLSEQQIVDCAWVTWGGEGGNSGCDGGFAAPAFQWIMDNGGIAFESHYKYLMQDGYCRKRDLSSGVKVRGYVNVTSYSESALEDAVANNGPVAVAIDASHSDFTFYTSGVYYNPNCASDINDLDHEVLVVGYGTENGEDYWLVKIHGVHTGEMVAM